MVATVSSSSSHELFLPDLFAIFQRLHWRSPAAHLSLMCSFIIVVFQPYVQIGLQFFNVDVEFLAERNLVELLQDRLSLLITVIAFSSMIVMVFSRPSLTAQFCVWGFVS